MSLTGVSEGGLEGLLPSPGRRHRRPRAVATSGVTSAIRLLRHEWDGTERTGTGCPDRAFERRRREELRSRYRSQAMKGGHVLDPTEHGHLGLRQHREHLLGVEVGDFLLGHHEDHTATPRMRSPPNAHGTGAVPCSRPGPLRTAFGSPSVPTIQRQRNWRGK